MASASFTIDSTATTSPVATTAGATVNLALSSTVGVRSVEWSILGGSDSSKTVPTITPAGFPSGATATFTMNTPVGSVGLGWLIQCRINGGKDIDGQAVAAYTATGLVGVVNSPGGRVPFVFGEESEREPTYGITDDLNDLAIGIGADATSMRAITLDATTFGTPEDGDYPYYDASAGNIKLGKTFISTHGRLADDGTDQRANLQTLIDEAQPNGAEVVIHPSDNGYTFSDTTTIIMRPHVTLRGSFRGHRRGLQLFSVGSRGSLFLVKNASTDFMELQHNVTIDGVEFFYPDQVTTGTPTAYPWLFNQSANSHAVTVRNVACPNPYQFMQFNADGATLDSIYAYPLSVGLDIVRVAEVLRVNNVHFSGNCFPALDPSLTAWVLANGDAIKVTGPEEFLLTNFFAFGYNRAIWFTGAGAFHGVYGQWHGGGADQCNTCVLISNQGLTSRGFKLTGVNLIPNTVGVQFSDTGGATGTPTEDEHPMIHLHDVNVWNGSGFDRPVWFQASSHGRLIVTGGRWRDSNNEGAGLIESSDAMVRTYGLGVPSGTGNSWRWRDTTDAADVQEHGIHD